MDFSCLSQQSFGSLISEAEFRPAEECQTMLEHDEADLDDAAMPKVFAESLNCSNWTLNSLQFPVSEVSDTEKSRRRLFVDQYLSERSYACGFMDSDARPNFDMEFTSPSTDRSAVAYYRAGSNSSNCRSVDEFSVGSWQLSRDQTLTSISSCLNDSNDIVGDGCRLHDLTQVTEYGDFVLSSDSESVVASSCEIGRTDSNSLANVNIISPSCKKMVVVSGKENSLDGTLNETLKARTDVGNSLDGELTPSNRSLARVDKKTSTNRVLQENATHSAVRSGVVAEHAGRMKLENKENENPADGRSRRNRTLDSLHQMPSNKQPPVCGKAMLQRNDSDRIVARFARNQIWNASDGSFKSPCSSNKSISHKASSARTIDSENMMLKPAVECFNSRLGLPNDVSECKNNQYRVLYGLDKGSRPISNDISSFKDLEASSTPVKKAAESVSHSVQTKELTADKTPMCGMPNANTNTTIPDISLDLTYESTVRLSLPADLGQPDFLALAKTSGDRNTKAVGIQTSALLPANLSNSSSISSPRVQNAKYDDDGYSSGRSQSVVVSPELRFDGVCCIGLSSSATLSIHNPSVRWQCIHLNVTHCSIDGRAEDQFISPFVVKSKVTVDPNSTESVKHLRVDRKRVSSADLHHQVCLLPSLLTAIDNNELVVVVVIFAPRLAGVHVAQLSLVSSSAHVGQLPVLVTLQAVAERPSVDLLSSGRYPSQLLFTSLPWGCETYECITLVNRGRSTIPVQLKISSSQPGVFAFEKQVACKSHGSASKCNQHCAQIPKVPMPILHRCVMLGGSDDGAGLHRQIPVYFTAPRRQSATRSSGGEEITGSIIAEVDIPTNAPVLAVLDVIGKFGLAKLHIPKTITPMYFTLGQNVSKSIPIRNSGEIPLSVDLGFSSWSEIFMVTPDEIRLDPGEDVNVSVTFCSNDGLLGSKYESYMVMQVKPDGPVYELKLIALRQVGAGFSSSNVLPSVTSTVTSDCSAKDRKSPTLNSAVSLDVNGFLANNKIDAVSHSKVAANNKTESSLAEVGPKTSMSCANVPNSMTISRLQTELSEKVSCKSWCQKTSQNRDVLKLNTTVKPLAQDEVSVGSELLSERTTGELTSYNSCIDTGHAKNKSWAVCPDSINFHLSAESAAARQLMIFNYSDSDLLFDVCWPAHVLSVAPEHGVVSSGCHLMILVSVVGRLSKKMAPASWSGSIQISSGSEMKIIRVEIRDTGVHKLPTTSVHQYSLPAAASAVSVSPVLMSAADNHPAIVDISVPEVSHSVSSLPKTPIRFPLCAVGDTQELFLHVTNKCPNTLNWFISPAGVSYLKRPNDITCVHPSCAVFWWPSLSGILLPNSTEKLRMCFCPNEPGHYSQLWQIQFETEGSKPDLTHVCQVETYGLTKASVHQVDVISSSVEQTVNSRASSASLSQQGIIQLSLRSADEGTSVSSKKLSVSPKTLDFSETANYKSNVCKVKVKNRGLQDCTIELSDDMPPFFVRHRSVVVRSRSYMLIPVEFKPQKIGVHRGVLIIKPMNSDDTINVQLCGVCV